MTKFTFHALAVTLFLLIFTSGAQAQSAVYVSGNGADTGSCTRSAPCKTFSYAYGKNSPEIIVLDAGEYGTLKITRSLTITAVGVYAEVYVPSGTGIAIDADTSDKVVLRGLTIRGNDTDYGVYCKSLGELYVEDCSISGFTKGGGLYATAARRVFIKNTSVKSCFYGFYSQSPSSTAICTAYLDHCSMENNRWGLTLKNYIRTTIRDSIAVNNWEDGVNVNTYARLDVEGCLLAGSGYGVNVGKDGTVYLSNTVVTDNTYGLINSSGKIFSYGNNMFEGNLTNVLPNGSDPITKVTPG